MLQSSTVLATMPAVNINRAIEFYTKTLGLKLDESDEGSATFEAGNGTKIFMYQREATKAEHTSATFYVDDHDAVVTGLISKGVVFEQYDFGEIKTDERGVMSTPDGKAAWLKDTEGNILGIFGRA